MKKSTRRLLKRTVRKVRKSFRNIARPLGGTDKALMLGAVVAAAALDPEVRARTKGLALAVIDRIESLISQGTQVAVNTTDKVLERAH